MDMADEEPHVPIPLDPAEDITVTLDRHANLPLGQRPAWRFKFLTRREMRELVRIWRSFDEAAQLSDKQRREDAAEEAIDTLCAFMQSKLVGWKNQAFPYDPARFDETVLDTDLVVLMVRLRAMNQLGPQLLAKLESQSLTRSGESADAPVQDSTPAKTPRAPESRPSQNAPHATDRATAPIAGDPALSSTPTAPTATAQAPASSATAQDRSS